MGAGGGLLGAVVLLHEELLLEEALIAAHFLKELGPHEVARRGRYCDALRGRLVARRDRIQQVVARGLRARKVCFSHYKLKNNVKKRFP